MRLSNKDISNSSYKDFTESLAGKASEKRIPIFGQWELTFNCNLNCVHCYVVKDTNKGELTFLEITDILDQLHEAGCLWLSFTGGEPLMRPDFLEVYTYAKKKGFLINILTNGTLVTPKIADYLREYPPFMVEITLNGITAKTYETVTGVSGSFQRCLEGIRLIKERNLPLRVKSNGMKINRDEILKIKEYVQGLGIDYGFDSVILPRLDGSKGPCKLRLSPDEIVSIEHQDPTMQKEWQGCFKEEFIHWNPNLLFRCEGGINSFYIGPYGRLMLCHAVRYPSFDLMKGSFQEGFYNFLLGVRSRKYKTNSPCRLCEIYDICRQCPGRAQIETGDPETPVEYFCQLAHKHSQMSQVLQGSQNG